MAFVSGAPLTVTLGVIQKVVEKHMKNVDGIPVIPFEHFTKLGNNKGQTTVYKDAAIYGSR